MATEVEEKTHAVLGPSGAAAWSRCPGKIVLEEGEPDSAGYHAKWGTAGHELAAIMLEPYNGATLTSATIEEIAGLNAESYLGRVFLVEGDEFEVCQDMATCVNDYIAHATDFLDPGDLLLVEQALPIEHITGEKGATGTGDMVVLKVDAGEIVSIDLKTGKGVQVYAEGNEQCTMYADGARFEHDVVYGPFTRFRNVIIQPRIEHVDEEIVDLEDHERRVDALRVAALNVGTARELYDTLGQDNGAYPEQFEAFLTPGTKQCRFCKAKAKCPALEAEVSKGLENTAPADRDDFPDLSLPKQASAAVGGVEEASSEKLSAAMRAADLIEAWLSAVRAEVDRRLLDGQEVPGYKLVMGKRSARFWTDQTAVEERMQKARIKVDTMYSKKLISPTQAEKLVKSGDIGKRIWADLAEFIDQKDGSPAVAPEDDPREVYNPVASADDFPVDNSEVDPFS
jgi:hypothetical protein